MPTRRRLLALLGLLAALLLGPAPGARAQSAGLDDYIRAQMGAARVPGLAACIVKDDAVVWARGYGLRDIAQGLPVTPQTPFMLASVSKTITGTALMQLWDQGDFLLDDDVDPYLAFPVDNPSFPGDDVTFRQVLSHVASIRDNWGVMNSLYTTGDSPVLLGRFLAGYLVPGGKWYDASKNYFAAAPGTQYAYSNIGFALAGHLVEAIEGVPFDLYCQAAIFQPLGMQDTSWRFADFAPDTVAMPYGWKPATQSFVPYGYYGYPDYPNGCLRSSVLDLARFLLAHMNRGSWNGVQVLSPAAEAEMRTIHYPALNPTQGLAFYTWKLGGMQLIGHAGGDLGVSTEMWMRPDRHTGVIVLTNGDAVLPQVFDVLERLFREAEQL
jgi:CubicO group peptidase (beta-lactamase class C family)